MKEIIRGKLYDTEESQFIHSVEIEIHNNIEEKVKIEKLYKTIKNEKFFLVVYEKDRDPFKFTSQQVLDNKGWEIFEISDGEARMWAEKFLSVDEIQEIFSVDLM